MTPNAQESLLLSSNAELSARDLAVVWHPCTQMKDHEQVPLIPIRRGAGAWLEDFDGNRYLDGISSWWVNLFGHAHPRINAAVRAQLDHLEHVIFAGFTHEPAVRLAERLVAMTPPGLERCFFADNGSAAVEVALKMSFHYWLNHGRPTKRRFMTLANSYHGETLGALAVGDVALYKKTYEPLLKEALVAPSPDCYARAPDDSWAVHSRRMIEPMLALLEQHHQELCAVIVEPLVQCAGAMRMYHPVYLELLREACHHYHVHLIADEIAVGFGRTGSLFACEQANISPDFLCLSKGLTGGYLPLSVVLTSAQVYNAFYAEYAQMKAFLHSHSYTGNPLACAAALATLDLIEDDDVITGNAERARVLREATAPFADHPHVAEVRQTGMIAAIEFVRDKPTKTPYPWEERRGLRVYRHALGRGALIRPIGNVIYFMPPYVVTAEEIRFLAEVTWEGLELATRDP